MEEEQVREPSDVALILSYILEEPKDNYIIPYISPEVYEAKIIDTP